MDLRTWIAGLSLAEQERYFRRAAGFFSSRDLQNIIGFLRNRESLYRAHLRAGVLERYQVDLENLRRNWPEASRRGPEPPENR